ncbi:MAG: DNA polymerase IV [Planctomycetaceae bacterium]|nr:DNA polymerase IV [Planctomycetaceae bacterium]
MIIHVDMDAFYASVEERERPELRGKPVIVGGTPEGRGVVAAANYAVRKFGVHSAMPTSTALRLCRDAIVLRPRIDYYAEVSRQIRDVFHHYTPLVEPLSLDEAFLDVSGCIQLFGSAEEIGRKIKQDIKDELQLVASVGVATNKFLAKFASDLDKPDGFVVVQENAIREFLDPLPVGSIWGVGRVAGKALGQLGIRTIGQLRGLSRETLDGRFGKMGEHMWNLARGIDDRAVIPDREAKSISHETTFARDVEDFEVLQAWLMALTEQVARRLRRHSLRGRTVQLKVRYDDFDTITRSQSLPEPTNSTDVLWRVASNLLSSRLPDRHLCVRLIGIGVGNVDRTERKQQLTFDDDGGGSERLDEVTDKVKDRFGPDAIRRAIASGRSQSRDKHSASDP